MSVRCETCDARHLVRPPGADRDVPCTSCPIPCRQCANGAYCATAACSCSCHHWLGANESCVPPPDPPTRHELVALLQRWRDLETEPQVSADDEDLAEHVAWSAKLEELADETDRTLAAEWRRPNEP